MLFDFPIPELTAKGIATAVARAVRDDRLAPGTQLPPIRTIATELGVSPTTVASAWQTLLRSGVIVTAGRRGSVIASTAGDPTRYRKAIDPARNVNLDLSGGMPDPRLLPDLRTAVQALSRAVGPGSYLDDPIVEELQLLLRDLWPFPPSGLTVVDGAMDALDLTARTLLGFGDRAVVETPCFPPLLDLLEAHRIDVIAVPLDGDGLDLDRLQAALRQFPRAVFLQPRAQNPTGVSMSPARARQIGELLAGSGAVAVEDESWGAVAQADPVSVGTWIPDQTVHVRSFSKSHGPDLRIAAMSGPTEVMHDIARLRQHGQGWTSRILQRILLELLTNRAAQEQVAKARAIYAERRTKFVIALTAEGVHSASTDGFNLWIPVADETTAVLSLANDGIGVAPGAPFQPGPDFAPHIRVTVSALDGDYERAANAVARASRGSGRPIV